MHSTYSGWLVRSKRMRSPEQTKLLRELGHRVVVLELQGDLLFASAEIVVSEAMRMAQDIDYLILDFRRVAAINDGATNLLGHLVQSLDAQGKTVLFTSIRDEYAIASIIKKHVPHLRDTPLFRYQDVDHALEWCEDRLLAACTSYTAEAAPLAKQVFCAGVEEELSALESLLEPKSCQKGGFVFREGEPATGLYFILSGQVSVIVPVDHRRSGRITTLSAGSAFGEMAMFDHGVRSADVVADTELSCLFLNYENLENDGSALGARVRLKLVTNIARVLAQKLRQATLEIKSLKS